MVKPGSQVNIVWRSDHKIFTKGHRTRGWQTYNLTPECKHSSQAQTSPQWDSLSQVCSQHLIPGDSPTPSTGSQAPQQVEKGCHAFMLHSGSWLKQLSIIDTPYLGALIQLRMFLCPSQFIFQRISDCLITFELMISSYSIPLQYEHGASVTTI